MENKVIIIKPSMIVTCDSKTPKYGKMMNDLNIIYDKAIYIKNGIITDIDDEKEIVNKYYDDTTTIINANNKAILPGFIDSHTHLPFYGYREKEFSMRMKGKTYMEIMESGGGIINTVTKTRNATEKDLIQETLPILKSMLSFGITTIEGKSGYGLDLDTEIKQLEVLKTLDNIQPIDIVRTYLGAHDLPFKLKSNQDLSIKTSHEYIDYIVKKVLPIIKEKDLASFVDIFVEKNVFTIEDAKYLLMEAKKLGFKIKIHADELTNTSSSSLAATLGCTSADHLLHASDEGIKALSESKVITTLLPLTAFNLKEKYADARKFIDCGCAVALASDINPGSCFSENIALVVLLSVLYMNMTIEEAISAVTINAAYAISKGDSIGSITIGKKADIIILDYDSYEFIPYHLGTSSVKMVIKDGKIVYQKEI